MNSTPDPETFLPGHEAMTDEELLRASGTFTPKVMFVATYAARLTNLHVPLEAASKRIQPEKGFAINSNFDHKCVPGEEAQLKVPKKAKAVAPKPEAQSSAAAEPTDGPEKPKSKKKAAESKAADPTAHLVHRRRPQGDGTCFNSALEGSVYLELTKKRYFTKCFPSTGEVQVPGALYRDMRDAALIVRRWVEILNRNGFGDAASATGRSTKETGGDNDEKATIGIEKEGPNMINFKFHMVRASPRIMLDLECIAAYFLALDGREFPGVPVPPGGVDQKLSKKERAAAAAKKAEGPAPELDEKRAPLLGAPRAPGARPPTQVLDAIPHGSALVVPPFWVNKTKLPNDAAKFSLKFGRFRVKIFPRGKINFLGIDSDETAELLRDYLTRVIAANRAMFVCLEPVKDEKPARAPARPRVAAPAAPVTPASPASPVASTSDLSDEDADACLHELLDV